MARKTSGRRASQLRMAAIGVAMVLAGGAIPFAVGGAKADTVTDEARFVTLINQSRAAEGLKPLAVHPALVDAARNWATSMNSAWNSDANEICQISHNPNLRTAVSANWQKLGENVGCGDVIVDELEQKFMESPKHRANIMDPSFDSIGIGIVMRGDVMFVTQQFMQLRLAAPATTTGGIPNVLALGAPKVVNPVPSSTVKRKGTVLKVKKKKP